MPNNLIGIFGLSLLLSLLVACSSIAQSIDGQSRQPGPDPEPANQSSPSYRLELTGAEDEAMCRALDAAIQKRWKPGDWALCSIPVAEAGPEFSMPQWRNTDGLALIDEIRDLALVKDWNGPLKPITEDLYRQTLEPPAELIERVWNPMKQDFVSLLQSRALEVQEAQFDLDNNGEIDTIYRIRGWTLKETGNTDKPYAPEFWEPKSCRPGNIDTGFLFFKKRTRDYGGHELADYLNARAGRRDGQSFCVFFYGGKTYQHWPYLDGISTIPESFEVDYCDWRRVTID